jgi:hypothetical protein
MYFSKLLHLTERSLESDRHRAVAADRRYAQLTGQGGLNGYN